MKKSFSYVIFKVLSIICFITGVLLLIFTKKVALHTIYGVDGSITNVIIKFLGSAYLLLGFLLFLIKSISGKKLIAAIIAFNIFGFVNLYLLLLFNELIHLSTIYFTFQALLQICLIIALIEKTKKTKNLI